VHDMTLSEETLSQMVHELRLLEDSIVQLMAANPVSEELLEAKLHELIWMLQFISDSSLETEWSDKVAKLLGDFANLVPSKSSTSQLESREATTPTSILSECTLVSSMSFGDHAS